MGVLALLIIAGFTFWAYRFVMSRHIFDNLYYDCRFSTAEAFEGDDILLVETVHNCKWLPVQWLKAEIHSSKWLGFAGTRSVVAQESRFVTSGYSLGGYQKTVRNWKVKCLKRGIFVTDRVTLAGGDFLNTATTSVAAGVHAELTVFPGTIDLDRVLVNATRLQGDTIIKDWFPDDPFLVCGVREYTPYDPLNRIHWPATARTGELAVRKYEIAALRCMMVLLNIQSMECEYLDVVDKGLAELGIKAAASVICKALEDGYRVGLASNGPVQDVPGQPVHSRMDSGKTHGFELLTILAGLVLMKVLEFEDFLEDTTPDLKYLDVVIVSPYVNETLWSIISGIRRQCCRVTVIMPGMDAYEGAAVDGVNLYLLPRGAGQYGNRI